MRAPLCSMDESSTAIPICHIDVNFVIDEEFYGFGVFAHCRQVEGMVAFVSYFVYQQASLLCRA